MDGDDGVVSRSSETLAAPDIVNGRVGGEAGGSKAMAIRSRANAIHFVAVFWQLRIFLFSPRYLDSRR